LIFISYWFISWMDCEFAWQFAWQLWDLRVPDVGQHRTSHLSLSAQRGAGLLAASPPKPQQGVFKGQWQIQFNHICNQYPVESSNSHLNCLTSHLMSCFRGCYAWPNHGPALFCLCAVRHLGQPDSPQWYGHISICSTCHATWNTVIGVHTRYLQRAFWRKGNLPMVVFSRVQYANQN
jgi:hypothetical protein